jgi:hypothetical protein
MDYVYICRYGDNEELRYSLRSVEKNFPKGTVWLVGGKPDWYKGNYIPVEDFYQKQTNALQNLLAITESEEINDNFILMNDDFFVVKPVKTIKTYHGGSLMERIKTRRELTPTSKYPSILLETHRALERHGITNVLDYDLHVPMPMTKDGIRKALKMKTQWRSTYGNLYNIGGEQIEDVKVYTSSSLLEISYDFNNLKYEYLSTDDSSFPIVLDRVLRDMFPKPSKYELY